MSNTNNSEVPPATEQPPSFATADTLKLEGNEHFRQNRWTEALASYRTALSHLPQRKAKTGPPSFDGRDVPVEALGENTPLDDSIPPTKTEEAPKVDKESGKPTLGSEELECEVHPAAKARAVLNANIGACYVKMGNHKFVVEACTEALVDDSRYVKALQRRAISNIAIDTWSSLTAAQQDYEKLLNLLPPSSSQRREAERALGGLRPRVEAAQKRETAEMLDKLKGLGNNILGRFGLSTDNFKFEPNGGGGYSMKFEP